MRIRAYHPDRDHEDLRRCFIALQDHEHAFAPEAPTGLELVDEYVPYMVDRALQSGGAIFVAERDGAMVGFASAVRVPRPEPDDVDPFHIELAELSVLDSEHGKGIGSALIEAVEIFARDAGAPSLRVRVYAKNAGARRLYQRQGFHEAVITLDKRL